MCAMSKQLLELGEEVVLRVAFFPLVSSHKYLRTLGPLWPGIGFEDYFFLEYPLY